MRTHFALTQAELSRFLGVSREQVSAVEAGRSQLAEAPRRRLWVLACHLPPPNGQGPVPPVFSADAQAAELPAALDPVPLHKRLRRVRFYIAKARYELGLRGELVQSHARRRWALAALRPALSTAPSASLPLMLAGATPAPATDLRWLDRLAADTAAAPPPLTPAERLLGLARLRAFEAELAVLEAGLAAAQ